MRRKEIKDLLDYFHSEDKKGRLTRDDQIDLWFKQMVFDLSKDVEDKSEEPLAKEEYNLPRGTGGEGRAANRPVPGTIAFDANMVFNTVRNIPTGPDGVYWNTTITYADREAAVNAPIPTATRERQVITLSRSTYLSELEEGVYDGLNHVVRDAWEDDNNNNSWVTVEYDPR
jgi:hypothetical protein